VGVHAAAFVEADVGEELTGGSGSAAVGDIRGAWRKGCD